MDISTVLPLILSAANDELKYSIGKSPARVGLVPSAIAWDECDTCGLLALSINRFFLTDQFPIEASTSDACEGGVLAADMIMQIIRCAPQPAGDGKSLAPTTDALNNSALMIIDDAKRVMCSVLEQLRSLLLDNDIVDYMIRQQLFVGPEGACVGSELQFVVGVNR